MTNVYDSKSVRQKNGEIVMSALHAINEPSTLTNIIKYISETKEVEPGQIKDPVKKVLEKAVEYGFVQKHGAKYSMDRLEQEEENDEEGLVDFEAVEDRSSRRRRRAQSARSKSRSRSRSKRRTSRRRRR